MNVKPVDVWAPFRFSVILCVIAVIGNVVMQVMGILTRNQTMLASDAGTISFLCFLPVCFLMTAKAFRDSQSTIEALETRIKQLESEKAT